jgi:serine/threonine protein phosphatase PrpC
MQPVDNCVQRSAKRRRGETMDSTFLTDKGKVRQHNEDSGGIFNGSSLVFAVVADGMGGHQSGDIASKMTVNELEGLWDEQQDELTKPDKVEQWLKESIKLVNAKVFDYAYEHEACKGMGTTLVAVVCTPEFVTVGHIGDSRCYMRNINGFSQITDDHSLVNELVRSGQISKEDAEAHPRKNVLMRALGTEKEVHVDIKTISWEEQDILLLCSDGLSNKLTDSELETVLSEGLSLEDKASKMIRWANERGGEDNISVAIVTLSQTIESGSE